jgi:hypothetical protein
MATPSKINQAAFEKAVEDYLVNCTTARLAQNIKIGIPEFEIRFGQKRSISKILYDNVVKELFLNKWNSEKIDGTQLLRISPEMRDSKSPPKIRLEIEGADMIEIYCKTNSFEELKNTSASNKKIKFVQKQSAMEDYIDYTDFDFRISSQNELSLSLNSDIVRKIIDYWNTDKKFFRVMNRTRFSHQDSLVFVDVSIVKSNKINNRNKAILCQTVQESGIFTNPEKYEIELELNNEKITEIMDNINTNNTNVKNIVQKVIQDIRKCIRLVLSGLQGTPYPISYIEQEDILKEYMRRISPKNLEEEVEVEVFEKPYFIGPSSITLQMQNIVPPEDTNHPNISVDYTVTEKADGERALLYISEKGKIYMIRTNLSVVFTGAITEQKECWNSLLDGEYIAYDKNKQFLNLFAAFDIYYIGSRRDNVRELAFCSSNSDVEIDETQYRLSLLEKIIHNIKIQSVVSNDSKCMFQLRCKTFYKGIGEEQSIFQAAELIWNRKDNFEYIIDGLIFTPMNTGVGSNVVGKANPLGKKFTWDRSFKWKPPEYNTIDFLISVQKDTSGKDIIRNKIIVDENSEISSILQYKTLILKCGFNPKIHKHMNVFSDVLFNRIGGITKKNEEEEEEGLGTISINNEYQPYPFQPTTPYDKDACYCNIIIDDQNFMRTHENEIFQDNMIIEFSYNTEIKETESAWKWVPLRVRYDKTSELRANKNNFGNDYRVANNNWYSIHFPITENMITGKQIPNISDLDDSVYYNRKDKDSMETQALKNFHNLFVKRYLIDKIANYLHNPNKMNISSVLLIDYAVGKCGDIQKWIESKIDFVFGIDISRDNIMNSRDGACVRYLEMKKKNNNLKAIFLHGNTGENIRSTQKAFYTDQEKEIAKSIFGKGGIDAAKNIASKYVGIGRDGFHISSCQFAMHYFFENPHKLHSFMRNLSECTKKDGFFIGTCYDGHCVFNLLRNCLKGENIRLEKNGKKIFEITKQYSDELEKLPDNENSIGLPIYVYQESINKTFMEYLVNFDYFERLMSEYGFVPLNAAENKSIEFEKSNGSFEQLFHLMENSTKNYGKALQMSKEEKTISFLNRYFVYKKNISISSEELQKIYNKYVKPNDNDNYNNDDNDNDNDDYVDNKKGDKGEVRIIRKIPNKKIALSSKNYAPIEEEDEEEETEYGEYQYLFDKLSSTDKEKITTKSKKDQIAILKKLQQKQQKKIVTTKK